MILGLLLAVTATFQPAAPTVGDRITIDFPAAVVLDKSADYEIVEQNGKRAVVRTFSPKPFVLSGTVGGKRFGGMTIRVTSVLKPNDDLKPAPLTPPRHVPYPRAPFVFIGVAAVVALAAWAAVWRFAPHGEMSPAIPELPAEERFRRAVATAKTQPEPWAALADATRAYLAETRPQLGSELTTTEIVPRLLESERIVRDILRQGDLEKFSAEGAPPANFDDVAQRALELAP